MKHDILFWGYFIGALFTSAALLSGTVMLGYKVRMKRQHVKEEAMRDSWRPFFAGISVNSVDFKEVPVIPKGTLPAFIELWLYWSSMLTDEDQARLLQLGRDMGLLPLVRQLLRSRAPHKKVLGATASGLFMDQEGWWDLVRLLRHKAKKVRLAAAGALLRIDSRKAMPYVLAQVADRGGWSGRDMQELLRDTDQSTVQLDLWRMARKAAPNVAGQLINVICSLNPVRARTIIHVVLKHATLFHPEMIAAALNGITDPRDAGLARRFVAHSEGFVRRSAVSALGRVGLATDLGVVANLLSDKFWWTRIRAAQVLYAFPGVSERQVEELTRALEDVYGKDALQHAGDEHKNSQRRLAKAA